MRPRTHLLAIVLGCLLVLLATTQVLTYWAARTLHEDVMAQRDRYLLQSLRTAAEGYLAIGLNLEQMQALQGLIERERAGFSQVLAIDVFTAKGTLLYSTDPSALGSQAPADWSRHLTEEAPWYIDGPLQRQMGLRFDNDLGQAAGGIVLTISTAPQPLTLAQWKERSQQVLQVVALVFLVCLVAGASVVVGLRRVLAPYDRVVKILRGQAYPAPSRGKALDALEQSAHETHAAWVVAQARTQSSLRQLQELDDAD
ncbi:MAG: hypothetical protein K2Q11_06245 [Burkholderiaceae bacterium]|nr:hypothetical protein [Burkholderiaceae bacterium]